MQNLSYYLSQIIRKFRKCAFIYKYVASEFEVYTIPDILNKILPLSFSSWNYFSRYLIVRYNLLDTYY